jgi:hypothetical protein
MTSHGEVVAWCGERTAARPWVVANTLACRMCSQAGTVTLSHECRNEKHAPLEGWETAAALAACSAGDLALMQRLAGEHGDVRAGVLDGTLRDEVSARARCVAMLYVVITVYVGGPLRVLAVACGTHRSALYL